MEAKIRFAVLKPEERPDFVERSLKTRLVLTTQPDRTLVSGTMTRTDMSEWRAVITGEQNPEGVSGIYYSLYSSCLLSDL